MPEGKKRSLKSVALVITHLMTSGVAGHPVSNTGRYYKTIANTITILLKI